MSASLTVDLRRSLRIDGDCMNLFYFILQTLSNGPVLSKWAHALKLFRNDEYLDAASISKRIVDLALSWIEFGLELLAHGYNSMRPASASITSEESH